MFPDPHETILRIYDTTADHSVWGEVLDRIADQMNARGCLIFEIEDDALRTPYFSGWYQAETLDTYNTQFRKQELLDHDVFRTHSFAHDAVDIIADDVLYDDLDTFKQRENVRHVMQFGILHRAAALLNKDNPNVSRFSVQFKSDRAGISDEERRFLNRLLPHIAKALDLGRPARKLAQSHQSLIGAMDRLNVGVCVLDRRGRVVTQNEEFCRQLDVYSSLVVTRDGYFGFARPADQKRLHDLQQDARMHGRYGARPRKEAIAADRDTFLCVELVPVTRSQELGTAEFNGFVLYSTDTSLPRHCSTAPIQHVYGLTDAELEILEAISEGLTNTEIAARRDRSVATVNSQVKSILSKCQCSTRTQLVRLMLSFGSTLLAAK